MTSKSRDLRGRGYASKFYAYRTGVQVIPTGVDTRVQLNTINFDILDEFDEAVLYQFSPLQAGYYWVLGQIQFPALPIGTETYIHLRDTGLLVATEWRTHDGIRTTRQQIAYFTYLIPTDNIYIEVNQNSGVNQNLTGSIQTTYLQGFRVG